MQSAETSIKFVAQPGSLTMGKCTTRDLNISRLSFWGAHGLGYMDLETTMRVPMGACAPTLSPYDHPNPSCGEQKGITKSRIFKNS